MTEKGGPHTASTIEAVSYLSFISVSSYYPLSSCILTRADDGSLGHGSNDLLDLMSWRRRAPAARVVCDIPPMSPVHGCYDLGEI